MGRDSCRNIDGSYNRELHKFCPQQIKPTAASFALSSGSQSLCRCLVDEPKRYFLPKAFYLGLLYEHKLGAIQKSYILMFGPGKRYSCCLRGGDKTLSGCVKSCRHTWLKGENCNNRKIVSWIPSAGY